MSSVPSISIVTPSYQQGEYIEETLLSVINQNYPNLEYFVIDGGSGDQTVDIIRKYEDHLSYWVSEPDNGQTDALNKGFRMANGEIFGWINSDDLLMPGALHFIGNFFHDHPDVMVLYGDGKAINREGRELYIRRPGSFDLMWLIRTDYLLQPSLFFRKSLFNDVGGLDEHIQYAMDYDLFLKMALKCEFVYKPITLSAFRLYPEAKTSEGKYPFSVDMTYSLHNILQMYEFPVKTNQALIGSLFWRVMEICLEQDCNNVNQYGNNQIVIEQSQRYVNEMKPIYLILSLSFSYSLYTDIIRKIIKNNMIFNKKLSDEQINHWINFQSTDLLLFSYRLEKRKSWKSGIKLMITSLFNNPWVIFDPVLYLIGKSILLKKGR